LRLRFTFISFGVGWKRGVILRRLAKTKTRKKAEKRAVLRSWRFCGVGLSAERARPVDHLGLPHVLDKPPFAQGIYRLSDGGDCAPPRLCAGRRRGDDAHCDLHCAYLGEPTPHKVRGEAEKPNASVLAQIRGDYLYKSLHEEEGGGVRAGWRRRRVSGLWGSTSNRPAERRSGLRTMRLGGG